MVAATVQTPPPPRSSLRVAIACAAWLAGACNQAFGLDPVALQGDASIDPIDGAEACEPVVAADVAGSAAIDGVFARGVAGAARFGSRVFLVGTHDSRGTDGAHSAIALLGAELNHALPARRLTDLALDELQASTT